MQFKYFIYTSLVFFLTLPVHTLFAQELPVKAGKILDYCYQFKLKSADSLLNIYISESKSGDEVELYMLKANIYWWKIISGINDKATKATYYQILSETEDFFEKEKDKGNTHLYKGISLYGYMARMDGLNKNYLKAFFRINSCLKYLEKSFGSESKYPFFYLSSGLYNYHMVVTARQYPVLVPYLSLYPKGDQAKGIAFLNAAAGNSNKYLSTEGHYFLMKIYLEEKKYAIAMSHIKVLLLRYPQNALFLYYEFLIELKSGRLAVAENLSVELLKTMKKNAQISAIQINHFQKLMDSDISKYKKLKNQ